MTIIILAILRIQIGIHHHRVVGATELHVHEDGYVLEVPRIRRVRRLALVALPADNDRADAILGHAVLLAVALRHVHREAGGGAEVDRHLTTEVVGVYRVDVEPRLLQFDVALIVDEYMMT